LIKQLQNNFSLNKSSHLWVQIFLFISFLLVFTDSTFAKELILKVTRPAVAIDSNYNSVWKRYVNRVETNFKTGKLDVSNAYPTLQEALKEGVTRLLNGQIEVIEDEDRNPRIASAEAVIRIVENNTPNIEIQITQDYENLPGVETLQELSKTTYSAKIINVIEITTGMIELLVKNQEGFERLIGAIAHELGHMTSFVSLINTETVLKPQNFEVSSDTLGNAIKVPSWRAA
jgi:hypothetical protein